LTVANGLNTIWVVLAAAMIVFMEGGFSLLEAGLIRTKNAVNVTMKIFVDLTFGALAFYLLGFGLMFGGNWHGIIGYDILHATTRTVAPNGLPISAFVLFQIAFAMAVASIISGAVAERMKFSTYIVTILVVCGIVYPVSGHWIWGTGGWLANLGMKDFAGSAAIHAMGGFCALALAIVLGPRKNRFNKDGSVNVFAPSNIPLASAGTFILWFGWFGFNAGSTLNALDPNLGNIALHTFLAAAAGGASSILFTMVKFKVADPSMAINGSLAGLVAITAGCAYVGPISSILIGLIGGVLVVLGTGWVDRLQVDDPVGAFAVHGMNGIFGTLAVGFLDSHEGLLTTGQTHLLLVQLLGSGIVAVWGFGCAYGLGMLLKKTIGIRVKPSEEEEGLDIAAHGIPAYNELERFSDVRLPAIPHQAAQEISNVIFLES
jgi:ammonium transporter, Amt family